MASLGHVYVGLAAARLASPREAKLPLRELCFVFAGLSMLPDADVVSVALGIPYESQFGHRGASHSLLVALFVASVAWGATRSFRTGLLVLGTVASHGLLDTLTDGGCGVALLWPFSKERYFAPWNPIPVAPIGLGFLSPRGLACAWTETMLFAQCWIFALWPRRRAA